MDKAAKIYFRTLLILFTMCLVAAPMVKSCHSKATTTVEVYDTLYIVSEYKYYVIDDSTLRKKVVNDTVHSLDTILPEFPVQTVRILRVDTIK